MKWFVSVLLLCSCTLKEEKAAKAHSDSVVRSVSINTSPGYSDTTPAPPPPAQQMKLPKGIYSFYLPWTGTTKIEHTVQFNNNFSFRLQERYLGRSNDSTVISTGTWTPSNGYLWLYKGQIAYARYQWKGDTLQYFNPAGKKRYSMNQQTSVLTNRVWANRRKEGFVFFGIGNEPFWNVQVTTQDSIRFLTSEWDKPRTLTITQKRTSGDSTIYIAGSDSINISVSILPYFCNDGMSDFTYPNTVLVRYAQQLYRGCGVVYRNK